jgi:hypothetical protein
MAGVPNLWYAYHRNKMLGGTQNLFETKTQQYADLKAPKLLVKVYLVVRKKKFFTCVVRTNISALLVVR